MIAPRQDVLAAITIGLVLAAAGACVGDDPAVPAPTGSPDGGASSSSSGAGSSSTSSSSSGSPSDGGNESGADGDPDTGCDTTAPFGEPKPIEQLNPTGGKDYSVTSLRPSRTGFYFSGDIEAPGSVAMPLAKLDLYSVEASGGTYGTPKKLGVLSSSDAEDVSPTESADFKTLYLSSGTYDNRRILRATRDNADVDYTGATPLSPPLIRSSSTRETDPYLVGARLYFSAGDGPTAMRIYAVSVKASGPTDGAVDQLVGLTGEHRFPVVNAAETEIFYTKTESLPAGDGQVAYHATRSGKEGPFTNPVPLYATTPAQFVVPSALSASECTLYLSMRTGTERFRVFTARRPPRP